MKNIQPLKVWLQHTLPTVYDDSLTYQDLLGKVLAKLNEVVESQNYVVDFVNTVDFQELVKNGLQDMVEDGTLADLINEMLFTELRQSIKPYFCVDEFGAVGDGVTDDTAAFNAAIATCPDGGTVTTKGKTYLISDITLNRSVNFDLNGATIINGQLIFNGSLSAQTVTLGAISTDSAYVPLNGANIFESGDIVFMTSSENFQPMRTYYKKGGVYRITYTTDEQCGIIPSTVFSAQTGTTTLAKISPVTVSIKNGKFTSNTPTYPISGVRINYGAHCIVENCQFEKRAIEVYFTYCYGNTVQNCVFSENNDNAAANIYGVDVATCTYTLIDHITGRAGQHMVTTGGWECCLYTTVRNSELCSIATKQTYAIAEHENAVGTTLDNCYVETCMSALNFRAVNCTFTGGNLPQGQYSQRPVISISGETDVGFNNTWFDNCDLGGLVINTRSDTQVSGAYGTYCGNVYINNCTGVSLRINNDRNVTTGGELVVTNSYLEGGSANSVVFDKTVFKNCTSKANIDVLNAKDAVIDSVYFDMTNDAWVSVTTADNLRIINCWGISGANICVYVRTSVGVLYLCNNQFVGRIYGPANGIGTLIGSNNTGITWNNKNVFHHFALENTLLSDNAYHAYISDGTNNYEVKVASSGFVVNQI